MKKLKKALRRGQHVVLHGITNDVFMHDGRLLSFEDALDETLRSCGYTLRCTYTIPDGITFRHPDMRHEFQQLDRQSLRPVPSRRDGQAPSGPQFDMATNGTANTDTEEPAGEPFVVDRTRGGLSAGPRNVAAALSAIRNVIGSERDEVVAASISFSDLLFSGANGIPLDERACLEILRLAMVEAPVRTGTPPEQRHLEGMRNAIVMTADKLDQVPEGLYAGNPRVQLVPIGLPDSDERRAFLRQRWGGFYGSDKTAMTPEKVDEFAALTEGLTSVDIESLRLCSIHEKMGVDDLPRLTDLYHHGVKDNPWRHLGEDLLRNVSDTIRKRVIGQEAAVQATADAITQAVGGISFDSSGNRSARPKGCLAFAGPTGTGKTETARSVTEFVFGDGGAMRRFDMGEFQQEHSVARLMGSPPGYVGYGQGGELTNHIRARPFSVLLFDEIEKAHPRIWDIFLNILEEGRLTDGTGETVYFNNALIIFTSNIGCTVTEEVNGHTVTRSALNYSELGTYGAVRDHFKSAVRSFFTGIGRQELYGRIGEQNVIVFDLIRAEHVHGIVRKLLKLVARSAEEERDQSLTFTAGAIEALIDFVQASPDTLELGGRGIRNVIWDNIVLASNRAVVTAPDCDAAEVDIRGGTLTVHGQGLNIAQPFPLVA